MNTEETSKISIEDLQREKLELELKKAKNPWYKDFEFWKTVLPPLAIIFSVLVTLLITWRTGILDAKRSELAAKKEHLDMDIKRFETEKTQILNELAVAKGELERTKKRLTKTEEDFQKLTLEWSHSGKEIDVLKGQLASAVKEKNSYKSKFEEVFIHFGFGSLRYSEPGEVEEFLANFVMYDYPLEGNTTHWSFEGKPISDQDLRNISSRLRWNLWIVSEATNENEFVIGGYPENVIAASRDFVGKKISEKGSKLTNIS